MVKELGRFVAIRVDVTDRKSPATELKNKKFKAGAIPFMVFYSSADVLAKDDWYDKKRSSGAPSTEDFLARLRALK